MGGLTNYPNGLSSFGIPQLGGSERNGAGSVFGVTYFIDPTNGSGSWSVCSGY